MVAGVALASGVFAWLRAKAVDPVAFTVAGYDTYFQSDLPRTYEQMVTRWTSGELSSRHVLYVLAANPPAMLLQKVLGFDRLESAQLTVAGVAAVYAALLCVLLRLLGLRRLDAVLFTAVGCVGASAIFWLAVPETFTFGAVGILFTLAVGAAALHRPLSDWWYVAAGTATLGMTLTNWASGILLAFTQRPLARAVQICLNVVAVTTLLWAVERVIYPGSKFLNPGDSHRMETLTPARVRAVGRDFFAHSAVMPQVEACTKTSAEARGRYFLSVQAAGLGSGGATAVAATVAWAGLLLLGLAALIRGRVDARFRFVLGMSILFQLILHMRYGGEIFLYSMHWWALLVPLVALSALTRVRPLALALAALFVVTAPISNLAQWRISAAAFTSGLEGVPKRGHVCDDYV